MNKYVEAALESYETIKKELKTFTRANTDFELDIGAVGSLRVICSSAGAGVDLGLKCHIQAEVLKKLLSRCQVCAEASLHAFKAGRCAGDE